MIGKYEFNSKKQAISKVVSLGVNSHTIVMLGHLVVIDETEDELLVRSELYAVDVIWRNLKDHPYGWKSYSIAPINPKHSFLGV